MFKFLIGHDTEILFYGEMTVISLILTEVLKMKKFGRKDHYVQQ